MGIIARRDCELRSAADQFLLSAPVDLITWIGNIVVVLIQFIDTHTNENMTELGSREWPAVPGTGDYLVFTNPVRKCRVASVTWVDLLQHHGKLIARVALEDATDAD